MSSITYTTALINGVITPELLDRMSKVCCVHCGEKNITLNAHVYLSGGKLGIDYFDGPECSKCNPQNFDQGFVDDNVYIKSHKLKCKEDYIQNKKQREYQRNKLSKDISSKQKELILNQELTFDEWYKETHPR